MTKRKKDAGLKQMFHPKQRQTYIDYDYTKQLSQEEKEWLSKFTDEYYGADFNINPTYVKENGKYIQISGNEDPKLNRDLRKYRKVQKYYKMKNGKFTDNPKYKYTDDNLHGKKAQKQACNSNANAIGRDLTGIGELVKTNEDFANHLKKNQGDLSAITPEELVILKETVSNYSDEEE